MRCRTSWMGIFSVLLASGCQDGSGGGDVGAVDSGADSAGWLTQPMVVGNREEACALSPMGQLDCWVTAYGAAEGNDGRFLEPPDGTFVHISMMEYIAAAIDTDGELHLWGAEYQLEQMGAPPAGPFDKGFAHYTHQKSTVCAVDPDGEVSCFGARSNDDYAMDWGAYRFEELCLSDVTSGDVVPVSGVTTEGDVVIAPYEAGAAHSTVETYDAFSCRGDLGHLVIDDLVYWVTASDGTLWVRDDGWWETLEGLDLVSMTSIGASFSCMQSADGAWRCSADDHQTHDIPGEHPLLAYNFFDAVCTISTGISPTLSCSESTDYPRW